MNGCRRLSTESFCCAYRKKPLDFQKNKKKRNFEPRIARTDSDKGKQSAVTKLRSTQLTIRSIVLLFKLIYPAPSGFTGSPAVGRLPDIFCLRRQGKAGGTHLRLPPLRNPEPSCRQHRQSGDPTLLSTNLSAYFHNLLYHF